jgi:hypothetical protein
VKDTNPQALFDSLPGAVERKRLAKRSLGKHPYLWEPCDHCGIWLHGEPVYVLGTGKSHYCADCADRLKVGNFRLPLDWPEPF